jgi:hypothetical protein
MLVSESAPNEKPPCKVVLHCENTQFLADVEFLGSEFARSQSVRDRFVALGDFAQNVECVHVDGDAARPAEQVFLRLQFSERAAAFVAALRAGELDVR